MRTSKQLRIRLDTFDFTKGLLMILIVLGHKLPYYSERVSVLFNFAEPVFGFLKAGANPAFFMIAGFSFRVMSRKKCLSKTFGDLIKPYLYVMAAVAVCFPLFHYAAFRWWPGAIQETIRYVLAFLLGLPTSGKVFLGYSLYECSVVWFLLALFISLNVLNWILNVKNEKLQPVLVLVSFAVGYVLLKAEFTYYCIPHGLIGVACSYGGYLIKKTKLYNRVKLPVIFAVLAVFTAIQLIWGNFNVDAVMNNQGLAAIIGSGIAGLIVLFLGVRIGNVEWKVLDPVKTVGVYTYWLMCIHSVDMSCIPWYQWSSYMKDRQLLGFFLEFAVSGLIMAAGCVILKKITKWRYKRRSLANG